MSSSTIPEIVNNPRSIWDSNNLPLFSIPEANPGFAAGQMVSVDNNNTFAFEDYRVDWYQGEKDYNDIVVQLFGASTTTPAIDDLVDLERDWRNTDIGQDLLDYTSRPLEIGDGVFEVDETGQIQFDFLYDGAIAEGELAIFNIAGMDNYIPGSQEFIYQAALRAASNSDQGYILLQDAIAGARFSGGIDTEIYWEYDSNFGSYLDLQSYVMNPGDRFGFMYLPSSTIQEIVNEPSSIWQTGKFPLFSIPEANPGLDNPAIAVVGDDSAFAFENYSLDSDTSDRDYNDLVFQVFGADTSSSSIEPIANLVNPERDWLNTDIGQNLLDYTSRPLEITEGFFEVDETGQIQIDFLYDGAAAEGELAIFNLAGMEDYIPGSQEFIYQAALRATSNSEQGYLILQDAIAGARFSGGIDTEIDWEYDSNFGTYLELHSYTMNPGDRFGLMYLPSSNIQEIVNDPSSIWQTSKFPLFSLPEANPGFSDSPMVAVDNNGAFAFENYSVDTDGSDQDYNDLVFQLLGATTSPSSIESIDNLVNPERDWRNTDIGQELLNYTNRPLEITEGFFEVDETGQIQVDFLYDGATAEGELAIFNLAGMENYIPGSQEFMYQAALRATSNSEQGYLILQDAIAGARFSGGIDTEIDWEYDSNFGTYLELQSYTMNPGDRFGLMYLSNSTIQEIVNDPSSIWQTGKYPLFSLPEANPGFSDSPMVAVGNGGAFAFENYIFGGNANDQDYNDLVFQIFGTTTSPSSIEPIGNLVNPERDWLNTEIGQEILDYTSRFNVLAPVDDHFTANANEPKIIAIDELLKNDRDSEDDVLNLISVINPTNGTVTLDGDHIIFTPNGTADTGSFEYTVTDGISTATANVTLDIGVTEQGSNSSDTFVGSLGDDSYRGRSGNDHIFGLAGNDSLQGGSGRDTLDGGAGDDLLSSHKGRDLLLGNEGNDTLIGGSGLDTLDGGEDSDLYLAEHDKIDIYSDTGNNGIDIIQARDRTNFVLELDLTFDADSGIEIIDGAEIPGIFEIRGDNARRNNVWDFSEIDLVNIDLINGKKGNDNIIGSAIADSIRGELGNDTLAGGDGNDFINGGKNHDLLLGNAGDDTLIGGKGLDVLDGGEDSDLYLPEHDNIDIYSDTGNHGIDIIQAKDLTDFVLKLGLTFNADSGIEIIDGAEIPGIFEIRAARAQLDNVWDFSEIGLVNVDLINGKKGDDNIIGSAGADSVRGELGEDTLAGGDGNDLIDGGKDHDVLLGNAGDDTLLGGKGLDTLDGGEGSDLYLAEHNKVNVYSDTGNNGVDTIQASDRTNFIFKLDSTFNADSGIEVIDGTEIAGFFEIGARYTQLDDIWDFSTIDLVNVDAINGRKGDDHIIGSRGADSILGELGNDTLAGGDGNDFISGGKDHDLLLGNAGDDTLLGGKGLDTLDGGEDSDLYLPKHNNINVYSDTGNNGIDIIQAKDRTNFVLKLDLTFNSDSGIEVIDGTEIVRNFVIGARYIAIDNVWDFSGIDLVNVDFINGRKGDDNIIGSAIADSILGELGNDTLAGGDGNDLINGGKDHDLLLGNAGDDTLTGGKGKDSFMFNNLDEGVDTITDFSVKDDLLVFSSIGFGDDLVVGNLSSERLVLGTAATDSEQRFIYDELNGDLFYDRDGNGSIAQVKIAQLGSGLQLSNNNFQIDFDL